MKGSTCVAAIFILFLLFPASMSTRNLGRARSRHHRHVKKSGGTAVNNKPNLYLERKAIMDQRRKPDTLEVAGSSLPDCSHACGSCSPCRLVMVSFVCASLEEAETCPIAYKCMCKNKSYPIP
ncbi:protein EPIDERMAL PATTERNING FACTOR 1 [Ziziphus jujuba]|uniref:Epidermal patterning factor-like protein n=1 Tax=Ziziphus jujuba TaxID=326968 RepID=A0A6P3ZMZ9_ZIZJJ|nr:protein EPIDERMAL PATTERNING FACTOR 1 [Ziziphus jujuba]